MQDKLSYWLVFKNHFPLKEAILGFILPKIIFFIGIKIKTPFLGGVLALLWCFFLFVLGRLLRRKINVFLLLAVVMIVIRLLGFAVSKNTQAYLFAQALDNAIYSLIFIASLFLKRPLIQFFAEESGAVFPEEIRRTPYYAKPWRILTAAWGLSYALLALALVLFQTNDMQLAGSIDMLAAWLAGAVLLLFSLQFPYRYWQNNYDKIQAYKE